jgi:hypothetical protein
MTLTPAASAAAGFYTDRSQPQTERRFIQTYQQSGTSRKAKNEATLTPKKSGSRFSWRFAGSNRRSHNSARQKRGQTEHQDIDAEAATTWSASNLISGNRVNES